MLSDIAVTSIAAITALVTFYIFFQTHVSSAKINKIEKENDLLKETIKKNHLLNEEIETVVLDLHEKIQLTLSLIFFYQSKKEFSPIIIKKIRNLKLNSDKHISELEVLSKNMDKKISALETLAKGTGDLESLEIIKNIILLSDYDDRIVIQPYHDILYQRLQKRVKYHPPTWTGSIE